MAFQVSVQRQWLFPVPIHLVDIANADELNRRILAEFHASRARHWHTHLINGRYENTMAAPADVPSAIEVLDLAEHLASKVAGRRLFISREGHHPGYWFNQTESAGATTSVHNHAPGPVLSGVYYVAFPERSGDLVFTRRRAYCLDHATGHYDPDGVHFKDVQITPRPGLMVLFPAWLDHAVTPNESGQPRTALAFNLSVPDDATQEFQVETVITG